MKADYKPWQLIETPKLSGQENMDFDLKLFRDFEAGKIPPSLRIYSWQPSCITLGYAQRVDELIDVEKVKKLGWDLHKRPTGGGIVFHNEAEVTYSLVMAIDDPSLPQGLLPAYKKISEAIVYALKLLGVGAEIQNLELKSALGGENKLQNQRSNLCFAYPADYEVVADGKKIVGSAQKRGKRALLQQGSIFVKETPKEIFSVLKQECQSQNAISLEGVTGKDFCFEEISEVLIAGFKEVFNERSFVL